MSSSQPDLDLDVIVRHMDGDPASGDQWVVFVGRDKRLELGDQQRAMVFARLLADLLQRRVWICHDACGALMPFDQSQVRGCSCC